MGGRCILAIEHLCIKKMGKKETPSRTVFCPGGRRVFCCLWARYFFLFGREVFAFLARRVLFFGAAFFRVFFPEDRFFLRLGFSDINQSSIVYFFLRAILFPSLMG